LNYTRESLCLSDSARAFYHTSPALSRCLFWNIRDFFVKEGGQPSFAGWINEVQPIFRSFSSTSSKYRGRGAKTITGRPSLGWRKQRLKACRHWLDCPSSGFLCP